MSTQVVSDTAIADSYVFRYIRRRVQARKTHLVDRVKLGIIHEIVRDLFQGESVLTRMRAVKRLKNRRIYGGRPISPLHASEPAKTAISALKMASFLDKNFLVQQEARKAVQYLFDHSPEQENSANHS
ncbi:MAG: hypothetical protein P1V97_33695 [Planctomycetota bacterium]|nr:hypothetical protein [Planctomycetota bacterium]